MDAPNKEFAFAGSLEELKAKGRLVVHGGHRPILVIYDRGRVFALDNRCPHMGFPLERGSVEDGILTCHWHHARFDLESGCTFDLWADDVPICPVEVRNGDVWVKTTFGHADPAAHWHQRLADGLAHDLGLVIAKAVHGQLAADVPRGRHRAAGGAVRGAEPRRLGRGSHDPHGARQSPARAAGGGSLSRPVPRRAPRGGGLRRRGAAAGACAAWKPAGSGRAQALAAALDKRAPSRGGRAHPAHGDCGRCSRRLCSPMPCSRPRPSGRSPTPDTRSTSSTRRSSAST